MSLASDLLEKMKQKGQLKIKSEPLPSPPKEGNLLERGRPSTGHDGGPEAPGQPRQAPVVDPVKGDHAETETPGPLFSESEGQSLPQDPGPTPQESCLEIEGIPSSKEIDRLKKPLPILSQYLNGKVVYLVRDEKMARDIEKQGRVAFTPEEIRVLSEKFHSMDRDEWVLFLKAACLTKKTFEGSKVIE